MKTKVGLIVEFNPFHNGHINYINEAKALFPEGVFIGAMSGNVVQRGELAIDTMESRKEVALKHGLDVILEIPAEFVLNNANIFARGAIKALNSFGVEHIVFGSETNNLEELKRLAMLMLEDGFDAKVLEEVKITNSYPKAVENVLGIKLESNDILGIAYISEGYKINKDIEFHTVKRDNDNFISASLIREMIHEGQDVSKYMPYKVENPIDMNDYFYLFKVQLELINERTPDEVKYMARKMKVYNGDSWTEFIGTCANKSFTKARLNREFLKYLLIK